MENQDIKEVYSALYEIGTFINPKVISKEIIDLSGRVDEVEELHSGYPYDINRDIFALNSLTDENGENAYVNFLEKNLYSKLGFDLNIQSDIDIKNRIIPHLSLRSDKKNRRRLLTFNYEFLALKLIYMLNIKPDYKYSGNSFYNNIIKEIDERMRVLDAFLAGKVISENDINKINKWYGIELNKQEDLDSDKELIEKLDKLKLLKLGSTRTKLNEKLNKLNQIRALSKRVRTLLKDIKSAKINIDVDELMELFDIEKFYLILAKGTIDYANVAGKHGVGPLCSISDVRTYVYFLAEELGPDYNPQIKIYDSEKDEVVLYDFKTLKEELSKYQEMYPERVLELSVKEIEENNIRTYNDAIAYYERKRKEDAQALTLSWELLKKGTSSKKTGTKGHSISNPSEKDKKNKELIDALYHRMDFLDETDYKLKAVGLNNFNGYVAFIYDNGTVLLESLYRDIEKQELVKSSGATYVMNIFDFVEFSKLSRTEIIEYISNTDNPKVRRFYHTKTWEDRVTRYLKGIKISIDEKIAIDKFLKEGLFKNAKK